MKIGDEVEVVDTYYDYVGMRGILVRMEQRRHNTGECYDLAYVKFDQHGPYCLYLSAIRLVDNKAPLPLPG